MNEIGWKKWMNFVKTQWFFSSQNEWISVGLLVSAMNNLSRHTEWFSSNFEMETRVTKRQHCVWCHECASWRNHHSTNSILVVPSEKEKMVTLMSMNGELIVSVELAISSNFGIIERTQSHIRCWAMGLNLRTLRQDNNTHTVCGVKRMLMKKIAKCARTCEFIF